MEKIFLDEQVINFLYQNSQIKAYAVILHDVQLNKKKTKSTVSLTFKRQHYLLFKYIFKSSVELFYLDSPEKEEVGARNDIYPFTELIKKLGNLNL